LVLAVAAGRVSNQLARPLETLERSADRFGAGDLAFRTDLADAPNRWVALEVQGVALAFNKMAARVEATVRGQRELLGAISHELRSPLGRARVAVEIARDRIAPQSAEDATTTAARPIAPQLDVIDAQLQEVDTILGDLLAVTRAGLADLRREPLMLVPWLRARLDEERREGPIVLETDVGDDVALSIDAALLARAVHNVIANARVHGHPATEPLVMRVTADAARVRLAVCDRGPGFAPDFLTRAFDPFVRGDAARARVATGGSGLGLALVRRIAEAHGGSAYARNAPDDAPNALNALNASGAEVVIELPR
jgi:two-component system OmpR family sensor kinase